MTPYKKDCFEHYNADMEESDKSFNNILETGFNLYFLYV